VKISEKWAIKLENGRWVTKTVKGECRYVVELENGEGSGLNDKKLDERGQKRSKMSVNVLSVSKSSAGVRGRVQVFVDGRQTLRTRENTW
jgi:hypothetical protein